MRRILYVGMTADYGDPTRGLSFEESNFHHPLRQQPGVEVRQFDFMQVGKDLGITPMSEALWREVALFKPHLIFLVGFDPAHDPSHDVVARITAETDTATLFWSCDDHWRFADYSSQWARIVDWIVTTDRQAVPKYQAIGCGHKVIASQWGANQRLYRPQAGAPLCDISFVGQPHGNRAEVLESLLAAGLPVQVFGFGWRRDIRRLELDEMIAVFARSKINLNLANSSVPGSQQIKGRNFEVPGCGGFLLTGRVPFLEDYFEFGREIVVFEDEQDLLDKLRYYLRADAERTAIARAGHARVRREHTWDHRLQAIFDHIGFYAGASKQPRQTAGQRAGSKQS